MSITFKIIVIVRQRSFWIINDNTTVYGTGLEGLSDGGGGRREVPYMSFQPTNFTRSTEPKPVSLTKQGSWTK